LERLGEIDYAFVSDRFLRGRMVAELTADNDFGKAFSPVAATLLLRGSATHPESRRRASNVSIHGVDGQFLTLFGRPSQGRRPWPERKSGGELYPPVVINEALQNELRVRTGDSIVLSFGKTPAIHPEFVLGSRVSSDLYGRLRVNLVEVLPNSSLGRFSLQMHQDIPRNVFLPAEVLQDAIRSQGAVNTLLLSENEPVDTPIEKVFQESLKKHLTLDDYGLRWRGSSDDFVLESREMIISPPLEAEIREVASQLGFKPQPVFTYLANSIQSNGKEIPYSTVSALDPAVEGFQNRVRLVSGGTVSDLRDDEILLNEWAANQLDARTGDRITLNYFVVDWQEELRTCSHSFSLAGIVSMTGLGVDQTLTPEIPGVQEAGNMASWKPPIPIDFGQIRPQDEDYWSRFKTAPKAFLPYDVGVSLWQSRFGNLTSFRFPAQVKSVEEFEKALTKRINLQHLGHFWPVKDQGLQAAVGATDFGMLFIGFSLFLIVSAVLLVALLFRLGVEQRIHEIGTLLSLGFPFKLVRRRFLLEGAVMAAAGSLLGLGGAILYSWLLIVGLQTLWVAAIGASFLTLHIETASLWTGSLVSLIAIVISISLTFRALGRIPATSMLAGVTVEKDTAGKRWVRWLFFTAVGFAVALLGLALFTAAEDSPLLFFGVGASVLAAGLSLFSLWLRREGTSDIGPGTRLLSLRTAARNTARNPGRSLLSTILVASACFVVVTVGANRHQPGEEVFEMDSGAGGYSIRGSSDIPLVRDLTQVEPLLDLGFSEREAEYLKGVRIAAYRLLPGEDISCRNLYQPGRPRVLGVPEAEIQRGGFQFQKLIRETDDPWSLLLEDLGPNVIPAFGDANSVTWILHRALGDDLLLENEQGEEIRLRLVGLLARSVFQSEILISETHFRRHFPRQRGYSYFLIQAPPEKMEQTSQILEKNLSRYGFDATPTSHVLAGFRAIENTYLSTFQTLGGLGLLLGTLGLAIVVVRNTLERRSELATLQAFGFPRQRISDLVLAENCCLLMLGIALGTISASLAVAPHLLHSSEQVPWLSLLLTLLTILVAGTAASAISVRVALRRPLLDALRGE
jgi:ABC-type antimicrobial peptide transport system permease subunit